MICKCEKKVTKAVVTGKRFEIGFQILNRWLFLSQNGKTLIPFFHNNFIKNIAIYGMGVLGERLYDELKNSDIVVKYGIDRIAKSKNISGIKIYDIDEKYFHNIDVIVVTPVQDYWAIVELLEQRTEAVILSLDDIVEYCMG